MAKKIRTDQLGIYISLLSVGISFFIPGFLTFVDRYSEYKNSQWYAQSLKNEIQFNYDQADIAIKQKEENKPVITPKYARTFYDAGINSKYFYSLNYETQLALSSAYNLIDTDEKSIANINATDKEKRENAIAGQAYPAKLFFSNAKDKFTVGNTYATQFILPLLFTTIGLAVIVYISVRLSQYKY